jgi:hypothetical protein
MYRSSDSRTEAAGRGLFRASKGNGVRDALAVLGIRQIIRATATKRAPLIRLRCAFESVIETELTLPKTFISDDPDDYRSLEATTFA